MNKEPWPLYIFRLLMLLALAVFAGMIYWSSLLVEQDLHHLEGELSTLKQQLGTLQKSVSNMKVIASEKPKTAIDPLQVIFENNLLKIDPFYEKTLPDLLGSNFLPEGEFKQATIGKPKNLHPFANWVDVSSWRDLCTLSAATLQFGIYETMAPSMAVAMEESSNPDTAEAIFTLHLRNDVFWEPIDASLFSEPISLSPHFAKRHPVTAHDFKFYFDAIMNPHIHEAGAVALRNFFSDISKVEVKDDQTLVITWQPMEVEVNGEKVKKVRYISKMLTGSLRPLARFLYQYFPNGKKIVEDDSDPETYRKSSLWAQNFAQHWAMNIIPSCGPWIFSGMTEREIKFIRNPRYFDPLAALVGEKTYRFKETPDAIWQDFKNGELETTNLNPDQLIDWNTFSQSPEYAKQVKEGKRVNRLDYLMRAFSYIGWNQATPYFSSKKVRQAMTMAIDRRRIIDHIMNGMAVEITGPFFVESTENDPSISPWPFDPVAARRLLEEEGWLDTHQDGIREKLIDGKRVSFSFSLTYYVKNPVSKAISEFVSTALKEVGVECRLKGVDLPDLSNEFEEKSFDALYLAWALGTPPSELRQLWHSSGAKLKGSSNAFGFANAEADQIAERLDYEDRPEERVRLYHRFHQIVHDEAPYTFLYTPKIAMLYREYLKNVFIPADRQNLIPGADVEEPQSSIFYIKHV